MNLRFFADQCVPGSIILALFISSHSDGKYFIGKLLLIEPHRVRIHSHAMADLD
jgi:hypothetical protein